MTGRALEVFLTVDVEHGGSSFARSHPEIRLPPRTFDCDSGDGPLGLPFIVSTLRARGLRATFFVEPLSSHYFGREPLAAAVSGLLASGMDVQLNAHPAWLRFADGRERPDRMHAFPEGEQQDILREARRLLSEAGAPEAVAFRAGGFGADEGTYAALKALGFTLSSSYNLACLGGDCRIAVRGRRNDAFAAGGVVEIPLTNYLMRDPRRGFLPGERHFQVGNTRFRHGRRVLEAARAAGLRCVTVLLHNFEFVRRGPRWFLEPFRPHPALMQGFRDLCDHLAAHPDRYAVRTFGELDAEWRRGIPEGRGGDALPRPGGFYWPI